MLKHYLEYIKFERDLFALIAGRKHMQHGAETERLEQSILRRTRDLYHQASVRFPNELRLWEDYFMFSVSTNSEPADIRELLNRMLQFHGDKLKAWLKSIKWHRSMPDVNEMASIKLLIMQALQRHPKHVRLHVELMNVTLTQLATVDELAPADPSAVRRPEMIMQQADIVYNNGYASVSTLEYVTAMLTEVESHINTTVAAASAAGLGRLQRRILDTMKDKHCHEPLFWHTIAMRELCGLVTYKTDAEQKQVTRRAKIEFCVQTYRAAVKVV